MNTRSIISSVLILVLAAPVFATTPPEKTRSLTKKALEYLNKGFVGSYHQTVRIIIAKPSGADREEQLSIQEVTRKGDGTKEERVIYAEEDGKDVTEAERAIAEKNALDKKKKDSKTAGSETTGKEKQEKGVHIGISDDCLPLGESTEYFSFEDSPVRDGVAIVSFQPLPQYRKKKGITKGRLAWDSNTLEPLWLETEMVSTPFGISQLSMRFDFARSGENIFTKNISIKGLGGLFFMKRTFDLTLTVDDLRPASPGVNPEAIAPTH